MYLLCEYGLMVWKWDLVGRGFRCFYGVEWMEDDGVIIEIVFRDLGSLEKK